MGRGPGSGKFGGASFHLHQRRSADSSAALMAPLRTEPRPYCGVAIACLLLRSVVWGHGEGEGVLIGALLPVARFCGPKERYAGVDRLTVKLERHLSTGRHQEIERRLAV